METLFIGLAFFEELKYGVVCVTMYNSRVGFGPSQQKAFYWQESEVLITICYQAGISTQLSYSQAQKGSFNRVDGAVVSRSS